MAYFSVIGHVRYPSIYLSIYVFWLQSNFEKLITISCKLKKIAETFLKDSIIFY